MVNRQPIGKIVEDEMATVFAISILHLLGVLRLQIPLIELLIC